MLRTISALSALALVAACGGQGETSPETRTQQAPVDSSSDIANDNNLLMPLPIETTADITAEDFAIRVKTLADDTFEGRAPGSDAGEASAEWIGAEMARLGLEPGFDDSYLQPVGMVELTLDESSSGLSVTGGSEPIEMRLGTDAVIWSKRQTEDTLSFEDSELVFVGYGVIAPEYGWNDYEGLDVAGKTVVMLVNDPGFTNPEGDLFKGSAMTYYGRWTYKFEEAARQGATGAIVIHETLPASYGWAVVANSWSGPQADLVRNNAGEDRAMMEGWISADMAERLFAEADLDFTTQKRAARASDFKPVSMGDLTTTVTLNQSMQTRESHNVVGVIPGETRPEEYVMYIGHWDHLGNKAIEGETAPERDLIFNGAVDNATGISAILEIAEALAADPMDRSVILVAVTLEESGLLGSAFYAENPTVPLHQVVAGINIDAMLPIGQAKDMVVVGYGASELEDMLKSILEGQDRVIVPDPSPQAGYFYRSDHISFAKKGVPVLYADGGLDKRDGGTVAGQALAQLYTRDRYHKAADEYDDNWNLLGTVEDVTALYQLGKQIANSSEWPQWYEGNEFKAIRDASRAGN
ncbi:MAG: M28 family metallopeptidase [Pseudomonadota bacterium]